MTISDTTENAILNLIYSATTWANYAQNAASAPETNIVVALHTGDPGEGGAQNTTEAAYGAYARSTCCARPAGARPLPAAFRRRNIDYPPSSGAGATVTHFSTGKSGGGASPILWSGTVTPNIAIGAAASPRG